MPGSTSILRLGDNALDLVLSHLLVLREKEGKLRKPMTSKELSSALSPESYSDITSFRLLNRRLNKIYKFRFGSESRICELPPEILRAILECNTHIKKDLVATSKKASLSVESFAVPIPSMQDLDHVAKFRLVCKYFSEQGLDFQFARVITRFSRHGFERLRWVANQPECAKRVKQFSYLTPRLYTQDRRCFEEMLKEVTRTSEGLKSQLAERRQLSKSQLDQLQPTTALLEGRYRRSKENEEGVIQMINKLDEQQQILKENRDFKELYFALTAFKNLQQIRFMKIVNQMDDAFDAGLTKFLEGHPEFPPLNRAYEWNLTCEHSAKTLTEAFFASNPQQVKRLSSRFIDPRTPLSLNSTSKSAMLAVARRLNSLELDFDNRINLSENVEELSEIFRIVFTEAINLQNLHVGFRRMVSVPIEVVFHHVTFVGLNYLGIHQWELEGEDLTNLILRHRQHMKYLRLRYVRLREGTWARVLKAIRLNLELSWVSLRGICYPNPELGGMIFPPAPPGPGGLPQNFDDDESDLEDHWAGSGDEDTDDGDDANFEGEQNVDNDHNAGGFPDDDDDDFENEDDGSDQSEGRIETDDENESVLGHAVRGGSGRASPLLHHPGPVPGHLNDQQPEPPDLEPGRCYCSVGYGWNDLTDNGITVEQTQWKFWQHWLVRRCHIHDLEAARNDTEFD